jgi:glycosyltransferase involved in cell wall biosynthesis
MQTVDPPNETAGAVRLHPLYAGQVVLREAEPPLKILHTESSEGWGGQEIRILTEAAGMISRGHQVEIAASPRADIASAARKHGIPVYEAPISKRRLEGVAFLLRIIRQTLPDVIVTHSSNDSWLVALASRLRRSAPPIVRIRHLSLAISRSAANRWLYGTVPARVVTTGEAIRQLLIERLRLPPSHVVSIPTGIDLERFRPGNHGPARSALGLPADRPIVGIVATLRSWKGHRFLIDAMADPRLSNAHLVIVGDGPQCDALVTRVRDSGIADRVTFAGRQGDVVPWLHSFNVFFLPSTGNEGVPQAVMQAMAAGLPIVSTPVGAIGEVVDDGRTGILVSPGE